MQYFISIGHKVLSSNHSLHLEKLQTEKYAYITDVTSAEYFLSEHCGYTIAPEQFRPGEYSVGLPLNSAYKDEVTEVYVLVNVSLN